MSGWSGTCKCVQWGCISCMERHVAKYHRDVAAGKVRLQHPRPSLGRTRIRPRVTSMRELTLRALATFEGENA